jgi:ubiquinone biosynthesis protein Coq4
MAATVHSDRAFFEAEACRLPSFDGARNLAIASKSDGETAAKARLILAAALAGAAFAAPEHVAEVYDGAASGWLGAPVNAAAIPARNAPVLSISAEFWASFWDAIDARETFDALGITARIVTLGLFLPPDFQEHAARASAAYPGIARIDAMHIPPRVQLDDLARCPEGSLGNAFYRLIVDNKFDLEVLDRDALQLRDLTPPLNYLNTRILQAHDLWHIVGGYDVTKLHEIGISAFQLAQFGHSYSAMFLAFIAAVSAFGEPDGFALSMQTIFTAWKHGRETAPMMLIPWEEIWDQPTEAIRAEYGIVPYPTPFPAILLEQLEELRA